jgi:hypothetical protein
VGDSASWKANAEYNLASENLCSAISHSAKQVLEYRYVVLRLRASATAEFSDRHMGYFGIAEVD